MKISVVIPNYNGKELLERNLTKVLNCDVDEVIVLDDGSKDKSWEILSRLQTQNSKLKVLKHQNNQGFIPSVNDLFKKATGKIVILLNNDVEVEKNFLEPVLPHFKNDKLFAVNLHEIGGGPAIGFWKGGFFQFKNGSEDGLQKSAWASGGSAAFRKEYWEKLRGFDELFAPFYWEDTDLSFRALKMGLEILWEPKAIVHHEHETTIKKINQRYVRWVKERNQLLFIWKNVKDKKLRFENRIEISTRILGGKIGYLIPLIWALWRYFTAPNIAGIGKERSDLEVINYAND